MKKRGVFRRLSSLPQLSTVSHSAKFLTLIHFR